MGRFPHSIPDSREPVIKLVSCDQVREHLREALARPDARWVFASTLSHLGVVAEVASIAEALGFEATCGKAAFPRGPYFSRDDLVVVCFATFDREALTERQARGFLARALPEFRWPEGEPLPAAVAVTGADTPAEFLAAFLKAAAAGHLLTLAEQARRN